MPFCTVFHLSKSYHLHERITLNYFSLSFLCCSSGNITYKYHEELGWKHSTSYQILHSTISWWQQRESCQAAKAQTASTSNDSCESCNISDAVPWELSSSGNGKTILNITW